MTDEQTTTIIMCGQCYPMRANLQGFDPSDIELVRVDNPEGWTNFVCPVCGIVGYMMYDYGELEFGT